MTDMTDLKGPVVLAVEFLSADRAAVRVGYGDGIRWGFVSYEEGERLLRELLRGSND